MRRAQRPDIPVDIVSIIRADGTSCLGGVLTTTDDNEVQLFGSHCDHTIRQSIFLTWRTSQSRQLCSNEVKINIFTQPLACNACNLTHKPICPGSLKQKTEINTRLYPYSGK